MNEWWKTRNPGKPDFLKGKSLVLKWVHMLNHEVKNKFPVKRWHVLMFKGFMFLERVLRKRVFIWKEYKVFSKILHVFTIYLHCEMNEY